MLSAGFGISIKNRNSLLILFVTKPAEIRGPILIRVTLSAGFEPAASSLEGKHSIQAELRELDIIKIICFKSFCKAINF